MRIENVSEASRLVATAIEIQLSNDGDDHSLEDAEGCLLRASQLDPNSLEALQELAHFYYRVNEQPAKAKAYAAQYKEMAQKVLTDMDEILQDSN